MSARAKQIGAEKGLTITGILVGQDDPTAISYNVYLLGDA